MYTNVEPKNLNQMEVAVPKLGTTYEDTYRRLRRLILSGEYTPRQRLVEADIVETLQVPRMAVRQALAHLEHEGLLEKQAGRSSIVRLVPLDELEEIIDARIALESSSIRKTAENSDVRSLEEMSALLIEMEQFAAQLDIMSFVEAQAKLHDSLLSASKLRVIPRLVDSLAALSAQTRVRTALQPRRMADSLAEHQAIVAAVAAKDPDAAEVAVRSHLANVRTAIRQSMQRGN